VLVLDACCGSN